MAETKTKAKKAPAKAKAAPKAKAPVAEKSAPRAPKKAPQGSYAVFLTGGKQYRVQAGENVKIEKMIPANDPQSTYKEGDKLTFDKVLLVTDGADATTIGTPYIAGATISATLKKVSRYKTVDVIKYKQKSRYFKKNGHRQPYFEVTIDSIQ